MGSGSLGVSGAMTEYMGSGSLGVSGVMALIII